ADVSGFEPTRGALLPVLDAVTAYLVALVAASLVLVVFGVVGPGMSLDEIMGKLVLQASAGSFGAILAQSTLSGGEDEEEEGGQEADGGDGAAEERPGYGAELLLMAAGALYLAMNIAPTEEVQQLAVRMGAGPVLVLMTISLLAMHAFVYAVEFRGQETISEGTPMWSLVLRFAGGG